MFRFPSCCAALIVCLLVSPCSWGAENNTATDWPQWRGPNRNGLSADQGLLKNWDQKEPQLLWKTEGTGAGYAGVSVAEGKIYTTGNLATGQGVVALNVDDGKVLWSTVISPSVPKHGYEGSRCTPSVDGDRLYAVTSDGEIACLAAADGNILWRKNFRTDFNGKMMSGWGFSESPLVDGDRVLCTPGGPDAMIVALDKLTGNEIWRSAVTVSGRNGRDGAGYSSMVVSEGAGVRQYVQVVGKGLIGVRASDGKHLWSYNAIANGTANIPTALVAGDYVFASTGYQAGGGLVKLSPDSDGVKAEEVYFLDGKTFQNHHGGMVMVGDYIYCGHAHNNGYPICLEWKTGKVAWGGNFRGPGSGSAAVVYADGNVVFRYQDGTVALIEAAPDEYRLKGTFKPVYQEGRTWAHPVIVGGRLYLREQNALMCYSLREST